jgi:hypothetical protein
METAYFVMHPTLGITAVVYAPSTEKARTTFLDWLERNNHISRKDRQAFRKNMGAQRLEDPNVPSDIVLHYGYEEGLPQRYRLSGPTQMDLEEEDDYAREALERGELTQTDIQDIEDMREKQKVVEPPGPKLMPVQEIMLRGFTK